MAAGIGSLFGRAFTGPVAKDILKQTLPGAGINLLLGTIAGGPVEGLAYAAGDIALNYPALRLARKLAPGTQQQIKNLATGKMTRGYAPSMVENATNLGASVGSSILVGSLLQPRQGQQAQQEAQQFLAQQAQQVNPALQSQSLQIPQQNFQRQLVNQMVSDQLLDKLSKKLSHSPGTMYQMQGVQQTDKNFHYPGLTIPPDMLALIQEGGMSV